MRFRNLCFLAPGPVGRLCGDYGRGRLPPYGRPDNPVHNQVAERYIDGALTETGALNMVTAIVPDYRVYDTMFETIVLFTATLAVVITLKTGKGGGREQ